MSNENQVPVDFMSCDQEHEHPALFENEPKKASPQEPGQEKAEQKKEAQDLAAAQRTSYEKQQFREIKRLRQSVHGLPRQTGCVNLHSLITQQRTPIYLAEAGAACKKEKIE
ncbi:unnamed protein product [Caenorhabditis auriculariae]|uniref:Uncharacterized protein n=1 Tax=Caenorhabditis auriculariae TaxID=2777116 RepID=A0A8S1H2G2_9PELO|nr:unnamed protein product [Caenorhabditis auriculariae]